MYKELKQFGKVKLNEPLSKHTTCKIGGVAHFFVSVLETDDLVKLLQYLDEQGQEYLIFGGGSNILPSDEVFEGVVVNIKTSNISIDEETVEVDAGVSTAKLAHETVKVGLTGFEWGVGIPGTIGGAVRGNAGAMGKEMKDDVTKVEVYRNGEVLEIKNIDCLFEYRESLFKHNSDVVLRVWLQLKKSDSKEGMKKALEVLQYRTKTQPQGFSSSGCIFKNIQINNQQSKIKKGKSIPEEFLQKGIIPAGWLIDQVGLKGTTIGGATVSEKHANFIVGEKNVCAKDIVELIEFIKEKVYTKYGLLLEEEIYICK
jgi:UDP-N-acetylmuramate dehydrogenase